MVEFLNVQCHLATLCASSIVLTHQDF